MSKNKKAIIKLFRCQRVHTLGIPDRFFQHGSQGTLRDEAGISPEAIAATAQRVVAQEPVEY